MSGGPPSLILRIQKDDLERQLFCLHTLYVGIRRNWSRGVRVLFVRKETFIGSGKIDAVLMLDDMEEPEKRLCIENNWYAKLVFSILTRFYPPVPVQETLAAGQNSLALHGATMLGSEALRIEGLASAKIIS